MYRCRLCLLRFIYLFISSHNFDLYSKRNLKAPSLDFSSLGETTQNFLVCTVKLAPVLGSPTPVLGMKVKQGEERGSIVFEDKPINSYINEKISPGALHIDIVILTEGLDME